MRRRNLLTSFLAVSAQLAAAPSQAAGPLDHAEGTGARPTAGKDDGATPEPPVATMAMTFTLAQCLALTDRNHPNLWAARARLASAHAQLNEATWLPFWGWTAQGATGISPAVLGVPSYTFSSAPSYQAFPSGAGAQPFLTFGISGAIPIYTFGKIDAGRAAAQAQVRIAEWDLEKWRQVARADVRRAFFGLQLARDAKYVVQDALDRLTAAIDAIASRLEKGDASVDQVDKLRLQMFRDEVNARAGEAVRGETFALAALRLFTGVQSAFDIPDEPLKRPRVPLAPVVRYLAATRIFRPEVAQARSAVVARRALLDLQRARFFPDIGLGGGGSYGVYPSITTQSTALANNPNYAGLAAAFGMRWSLDILPNAARVARTEAELEEARATLRYALGGTAVEVENAHAIVLEAKNREESWMRAEHRAKQWILTIKDAIDLGTKSENAMNEPLRLYFNARVNHMYALMDYNVAMSELARVSGWDAAAPTGH